MVEETEAQRDKEAVKGHEVTGWQSWDSSPGCQILFYTTGR